MHVPKHLDCCRPCGDMKVIKSLILLPEDEGYEVMKEKLNLFLVSLKPSLFLEIV